MELIAYFISNKIIEFSIYNFMLKTEQSKNKLLSCQFSSGSLASTERTDKIATKTKTNSITATLSRCSSIQQLSKSSSIANLLKERNQLKRSISKQKNKNEAIRK